MKTLRDCSRYTLLLRLSAPFQTRSGEPRGIQSKRVRLKCRVLDFTKVFAEVASFQHGKRVSLWEESRLNTHQQRYVCERTFGFFLSRASVLIMRSLMGGGLLLSLVSLVSALSTSASLSFPLSLLLACSFFFFLSVSLCLSIHCLSLSPLSFLSVLSLSLSLFSPCIQILLYSLWLSYSCMSGCLQV